MSFRLVRSSKFRHVYGQPAKREHCFDNIRISKSSWDSSFCAVNPKFIAIITEIAGGGAFLVLPIRQTGRVDPQHPLVCGHRAEVLDIAWCPFNDNLIASASEDSTVKIWNIPDVGIVRSMTECVVELCGHQKRVGYILWHPTASNVLLSCGMDQKIIVWNVGNAEILNEIDCHPNIIFSFSFNWNGSQIVTTCKDKKIRIIDVRSGKILSEGDGHAGHKPQRAIFMKTGQIFTTGFSKTSERQYSLRSAEFLSQPIALEEVDVSNGVLVPFVDNDLNLVYLAAKGDANIRYFEINDEAPYVHYLSTFQSTEPQRGITVMPKRGCDTSMNEVTRVFKVHAKGFIEVISMLVPRKSEMFQDDLYPDTPGDEPAITAEEWFDGKDADPLLISLKDGYAPVKKDKFKAVKKGKPNALAALSQKKKKESVEDEVSDGSAEPPVPQGPSNNEVMEELKKINENLLLEVKKLKVALIRHEKKITRLEEFVELKRPPPPQTNDESTAPSSEPAPVPTDNHKQPVENQESHPEKPLEEHISATEPQQV